MALIKQKTLDSGVTGEYHRIQQIKANDDILTIIVELYIDKDSRLSGKLPIERKEYFVGDSEQLSINKLDTPSNLIKTIGYIKLKETPDYSGAIDD